MQRPRAVLFDLDDTLAPSLQAPSPEMLGKLKSLLAIMPVAIVSGRDFPRMQPEFLAGISEAPHIERFYLLVNGASQGYRYDGTKWEELYTFDLTEAEKRSIRTAVETSLKETGVLEGLPCFGERYVDKGSMISYAMLGVPLPKDVTREWDPGNARRSKLWRDLAPRLPDFDVSMGGMTAIDIARKGINKGYGVRWLSERFAIPPEEMLYVGDALYEGGNDFVVLDTGVDTRATKDPEETGRIIDELLSA